MNKYPELRDEVAKICMYNIRNAEMKAKEQVIDDLKTCVTGYVRTLPSY